jgi:hypothetical protein
MSREFDYFDIRIARPAKCGGYVVKGRQRRHGGQRQGTPSMIELCHYIDAYKAECRGELPTVEQIRVHMGWATRVAARSSMRKLAMHANVINHADDIRRILAADNKHTSKRDE